MITTKGHHQVTVAVEVSQLHTLDHEIISPIFSSEYIYNIISAAVYPIQCENYSYYHIYGYPPYIYMKYCILDIGYPIYITYYQIIIYNIITYYYVHLTHWTAIISFIYHHYYRHHYQIIVTDVGLLDPWTLGLKPWRWPP